jgi:hypothetical protein
MLGYLSFTEISISIIVTIFFSIFRTRCLSSTDISVAFIVPLILSYFVQDSLCVAHISLLGIFHFNNMVCNPLYKFRNILGQPGIGVHSLMIFDGIPIVDVLFTFIGARILSYYLETNLVATFVGFYVFGQILHYLFGVNTRVFNKAGIRFVEDNEKKDD